jgi:small subunit ribosomal protein S6
MKQDFRKQSSGNSKFEKRSYKKMEATMEERVYDLIFICRPATPEDEVNKIVTTLEHSTSEHGGKIEKTERWGTRRLAYRVAKHREGFFVYMVVKSTQGELIKELERRLKVSDAVIKYQTIRLDEELKRQQKLGKHRERRASRRPRKQAPGAPPAPQPPQQQVPAAAAE